MTTAILMNPASAKTGKKGKALERAAAAVPSILFERLEDFSVLETQLKQFAKEKVDLLVLSGGDGTVQAALTTIAERKIFKKNPRIVILPHGTTNLTAADIGFSAGKPERFLPLLARRGPVTRATNVKNRTTVKVAGLADIGPQHGFFFGCGAITRAVIKCQSDVHAMGLKGDWATGATLALGLFKALFSRDLNDPDRLYQPSHIQVTADDEVLGTDENLMFLTTSLNKLIMASRPFWNQKGSGLHTTLIGYPVDKILRNTIKVMYGGNRRSFDQSKYVSRTAQKIALAIDTPIIIDGEIYHPGPKGLKITAGPEFEFVCGI